MPYVFYYIDCKRNAKRLKDLLYLIMYIEFR